MEWTEDYDHSLCQEILALEPFKAKKGSIARGQIWDQIASNLNSLMAQQQQQFQMFATMQQQQTQVILKLLEKQTK